MQTVACGYGVCGLDLGAPQLVDGGAGVVRTRAQEITAVYVGDRSSSRDEAVRTLRGDVAPVCAWVRRRGARGRRDDDRSAVAAVVAAGPGGPPKGHRPVVGVIIVAAGDVGAARDAGYDVGGDALPDGSRVAVRRAAGAGAVGDARWAPRLLDTYASVHGEACAGAAAFCFPDRGLACVEASDDRAARPEARVVEWAQTLPDGARLRGCALIDATRRRRARSTSGSTARRDGDAGARRYAYRVARIDGAAAAPPPRAAVAASRAEAAVWAPRATFLLSAARRRASCGRRWRRSSPSRPASGTGPSSRSCRRPCRGATRRCRVGGATVALPATCKYGALPPGDADAVVELFRFASPRSVAAAWVCLLSERKVVVASALDGRAVRGADALHALLWPLGWQHAFVPRLPPSLSCAVESPCAILAGVVDGDDWRAALAECDDANVLDLDGRGFLPSAAEADADLEARRRPRVSSRYSCAADSTDARDSDDDSATTTATAARPPAPPASARTTDAGPRVGGGRRVGRPGRLRDPRGRGRVPRVAPVRLRRGAAAAAVPRRLPHGPGPQRAPRALFSVDRFEAARVASPLRQRIFESQAWHAFCQRRASTARTTAPRDLRRPLRRRKRARRRPSRAPPVAPSPKKHRAFAAVDAAALDAALAPDAARRDDDDDEDLLAHAGLPHGRGGSFLGAWLLAAAAFPDFRATPAVAASASRRPAPWTTAPSGRPSWPWRGPARTSPARGGADGGPVDVAGDAAALRRCAGTEGLPGLVDLTFREQYGSAKLRAALERDGGATALARLWRTGQMAFDGVDADADATAAPSTACPRGAPTPPGTSRPTRGRRPASAGPPGTARAPSSPRRGPADGGGDADLEPGDAPRRHPAGGLQSLRRRLLDAARRGRRAAGFGGGAPRVAENRRSTGGRPAALLVPGHRARRHLPLCVPTSLVDVVVAGPRRPRPWRSLRAAARAVDRAPPRGRRRPASELSVGRFDDLLVSRLEADSDAASSSSRTAATRRAARRRPGAARRASATEAPPTRRLSRARRRGRAVVRSWIALMRQKSLAGRDWDRFSRR
ncbi:Rab guanyl-nucleotide exchange factor [Aureococcus anophagefferens]|nr:Rab guanyl-nucleotide exchange factor [Aureococcus anophagefferens]